MRSFAWIAGAFVVAVMAGDAAAQNIPAVFHLQSGATVLIGLDNRDQPRVDGGAASALTAGETKLIQQLVRDHPDAFGAKGVAVHSDQPMPPIAQNHIRFTFIPFEAGTQSLLLIENGFDRSFLYTARISRGGRAAQTDVCQVLPDKRGVEHWPYPLDGIEITNIHPIQWKDGDPIRCE
jgi:hypothetical protein